ncbi:MAG: hypothetical protein HYV97_00435 [Bdellovibrio sp.]|nr:hypothetical protein [Bdellovibrio sp.]
MDLRISQSEIKGLEKTNLLENLNFITDIHLSKTSESQFDVVISLGFDYKL